MYTKKEVVLDVTSPLLQRAVIAYFKQNGIPVYANTRDYDENYPYLYWNGEMLTQRKRSDTFQVTVGSIEEFLQVFEVVNSFQLSDTCSARIDYRRHVVEVGDQEFDFDKMFELAEILRKYKK